jgi:hypothetical protein
MRNFLRCLPNFPSIISVTEDWRKLRNEKFYAFYSSPNIVRVIKSRRIRIVRHAGEVGKPERRRLLERHMRRWEENITMGFEVIGWGHGVD